MLAPGLCEAQGEQSARPVDSIVVVGTRRDNPQEVIQTSGLVTGRVFSYRDVQRAIQRFIEDPLSEKILIGEFAKGDEIEVDVSGDGTKLDFRVLTGTTKA